MTKLPDLSIAATSWVHLESFLAHLYNNCPTSAYWWRKVGMLQPMLLNFMLAPQDTSFANLRRLTWFVKVVRKVYSARYREAGDGNILEPLLNRLLVGALNRTDPMGRWHQKFLHYNWVDVILGRDALAESYLLGCFVVRCLRLDTWNDVAICYRFFYICIFFVLRSVWDTICRTPCNMMILKKKKPGRKHCFPSDQRKLNFLGPYWVV